MGTPDLQFYCNECLFMLAGPNGPACGNPSAVSPGHVGPHSCDKFRASPAARIAALADQLLTTWMDSLIFEQRLRQVADVANLNEYEIKQLAKRAREMAAEATELTQKENPDHD